MNTEVNETLTPEQKETLDVITLANVAELTKKVIAKMGVEFIAPMEPAKLDEAVSAAILAASRGEA